MHALLSAFVVASVALSPVSAPAAPTVERGYAVAVQLAPCVTEDSDNCIWIAADRGNGEGESFTVRNGVVTYVTR